MPIIVETPRDQLKTYPPWLQEMTGNENDKTVMIQSISFSGMAGIEGYSSEDEGIFKVLKRGALPRTTSFSKRGGRGTK